MRLTSFINRFDPESVDRLCADKYAIDQLFASLPTERDVLTRAKELINVGWCRGRYHLTPQAQRLKPLYGFVEDWQLTSVDRYCAIGAIRQAAIDVQYRSSIAPIVESVRKAANTRHQATIWNDHPNTTKQDVLNAFDRAISQY